MSVEGTTQASPEDCSGTAHKDMLWESTQGSSEGRNLRIWSSGVWRAWTRFQPEDKPTQTQGSHRGNTSVGEALVGSHISSDMRGHTQGKSLMGAGSVGKLLAASHTSSDTREHTQGRTCAQCVGEALRKNQTS